MKSLFKTLLIGLGGIVVYKTVKPVREAVDKAFDYVNKKVDEVKGEKDEVEMPTDEAK